MKLRRVLALVMALCLLVGQLPATAWAAEASATITFEDTANRTVFTTEQQVWVVNGITFTNDKAAATSNVADYCNPVRCYAGSSVTVAYPGMTRIEYTCYSSTYAANLQKSIGDTATVADTVVTVAFDAPVDSYLIEKLAAQVRINSVTVYTDAGSEPEETTAPAEPTEPEETTAPAEPTEPEETTAPAEPTEPEETTAPAEPTEPEETTAPAEPTEPEETTAPTDPSEPEETTAPTDPSEPEETEPADPEADSTLSISEAAALGLTKEHNTYTAAKYYVTGKVAAILNTTYGNMHIVDEAGNSLYIYGTYNADGSVRFNAMDPQPAVGDTVTLYGIIGQNNGLAQMKNGWVTEYTPAGEGDVPEDSDPEAGITLSVGEAAALAASKLHNVFTAGKYYVTGVISSIVSAEYGNLYISDEAGNTLYIYGTYNADGTADFSTLDPQPAVGDTVTVYGILGQYYGTAEMKHGWITEYNSADGNTACGSCGDALTWRVQDGTLTISGTGAMADYSETAAPWSEYTVTELVINAGVTSISSGAFAGCSSLTQISFLGDAPSIGENAFEGVTAEVYYPVGNTTWTEAVMQNYGGSLTWEEALKLSYPVIERDTETVAEVPEENYAYFQFTPEFTETYFFYSLATNCDPYAALLDSELNYLTESDDYENLNFGITYTLEAGVTYVLRIGSYSGASSVPVMLQTQHENVTEIVTEATCSVSGLRRHTCQICGQVTEESFYEDHIYGEDDLCVNCGAVWAITGTCGDNVTWSLNRAGVLTISGTGAMDDYGWGTSPFANNGDITSVVIEEGVTSIGSFSFFECYNLQSVSIAGSVTSIGESAFRNCSNLRFVTISEGVLSIGEEAFWNSGIISVTIPASVISIGQAAFAECFSLDVVLVNEDSESYCTDDCGVLFNKAMTELLWAPVNTSGIYTVPEGVEVIGRWAFTGCYGMTEVVLPDSLTTICDSAFQNCNGLTKIEIPANVTAIGTHAFWVCFGLTGIWVDEANTAYSSDSCGVLFNKDKTRLIKAPICLTGTYNIPEGVTSFEERAFENCGVTAVTIPEGVAELSYGLFASCSQLTSVSLPESVTYIPYETFCGCRKLKELYIPAGVTTIEDGFNYCNSLTAIWVDEDNPSYSSDSYGVLFNKDKTTLYRVPMGMRGSYRIPDTVRRIFNDAFYTCALERIIVPSSVADIWWGAFRECAELSQIIFCGDIPSLEGEMFWNVTATAYYPTGNETWTEDMLQSYGGNITWVAAEMGSCGDNLSWTLADGTLIIFGSGDMADYSETAAPWSGIEFTKVTIEAGVTSISNGAFAGCTDLTEICFLGDVPVIGETAFAGVTAKALYLEDNTTWTEEAMQNYGGTLTWEEKTKLPYPVILRDTETVAEVPDGSYAYFQFKPEYTESYSFYSVAEDGNPYAVLLDSNMNQLAESDNYQGNNFRISCTLEAGVTYILRVGSHTGEASFPVILQAQHENVTEIVTEASCSVSGLRRHACQICGEVTEESYFLEHTYGEDDLCTVCGAVWALTGTCGENVTWSLNRAGVLTISGTGNMTNYGWEYSPFYSNYEITDVVIEEGVTSIGNCAFTECANLKTVQIADSVTYIGSYAFSNCWELTSLTIPAGVTQIDPDAFYECGINDILVDEENAAYCTDASGVLFDKAMTTLIWASRNLSGAYAVPETVVAIGREAFAQCHALTAISLPESLRTIGEGAFMNCHGLREITLSEGLISIGSSAFASCLELTQLCIPATVTEIGYEAFVGCWSLATIWVDEANSAYCTDASGVLFNKAMTQLIKAPVSLSGTYDIPTTVTDIDPYAFTASKITAVTIPNGVTSVFYWTFAHCDELQSVTIPQSVTDIDSEAFYDCDSLAGIWVDENNPTYCSDAYGVLFNKAGTTLIEAPRGMTGAYSIPSNVRTINPRAFAGSDLSYIGIPDGITCIKWDLFASCENLREIVIPASVEEVWLGAFNFCDSLSTIVFLGDAPYMESKIFYNVTATAYYPANNDTWTEDVRQGYAGDIIWMAAEVGSCGDSLYWTLVDGALTISGSGNMADYSETAAPWSGKRFSKVTFGAGVASVSSGAFAGCDTLAEICFEGDIPQIGENAFQGVTADAFYPESNATWTEAARQNYGGTLTWSVLADPVEIVDYGTCGDNLTWTLDSNGLLTISGTGAMTEYAESWEVPWFKYRDDIMEVQLLEGVTSIGRYAFYECGLTSITIPNGLTSIGEMAFYRSGLTSISFPNSVVSVGDNAFKFCTQLTQVLLSDGITSIGNAAFASCESLTSIVIPDGVTEIPSAAFSGCTSLESISIQGEVTKIADMAFRYCSSLTTISIPRSVTEIGSEAFKYCSGLTEINIPNSVSSIDSYAFADCTSLTSIVISESVEKIGDAAFENCGNLTAVYFFGDAPCLGEGVFGGVIATAYYPAENETWPEDVMQQYGGEITWKSNDTVVLSGTCNETVSWTLNAAGLLTVSGTGEITDTIWEGNNRGSVKTVYIEDGITGIGNWVFNGMSLKHVSVPGSVTKIGSYAFAYGGVTDIEFREPGLLSLGSRAFFTNDGLADFALPSTIESIGSEAFGKCMGLTELVIPASVTTIKDYAFTSCENLKTVIFEGDAPEMGDAFEFITLTAYYPANNETWTEDKLQDYGGTVTWVAVATGTCGENVTWNYEDGVLTISGTGAMYDYEAGTMPWYSYIDQIERLVIEEGVTHIGSYAFYEHWLMYQTDIPNSVVSLGNYAFQSMYYNHLRFGSDMPAVEAYSFGTGNSYVLYPNSNTTWTQEMKDFCQGKIIWHPYDDQDLYIAMGGAGEDLIWILDKEHTLTLIGSGKMEQSFGSVDMPWMECSDLIWNIVLPEGLTSICSHAFTCVENVDTLTVPSTVTAIDTWAFVESGIRVITFTGDAPQFHEEAFWEKTLTCCYPAENETWTADVMQNYEGTAYWFGYDEAGRISGTSDDGSTWVLDGDTLTISGSGELTQQEWAQLNHLVKHVIIEDGFASIGAKAFQRMSSMGSVSIPASVTSIGANAFSSLMNLTSVTFQGEGLLSIGKGAFSMVGRIEQIELPGTVTTIGDSAFIMCWQLSSIVIPASVTEIGDEAFAENFKLKQIIFKGNAPALTDSDDFVGRVFLGVTATAYYPANNATWTEEVMQEFGGSITWLREGQFALSGASVSLGNSLDMHFFMESANVDAGCYAVITRSYADGRENHVVTVPYSEWNALDDGTLYVTYANIAAKEMGDNISVVIYNAEGEDISAQWDDSIKTYAMRMLRTDEVWEDRELRTLYVDMLNYGAAAQSQFGYDTDNLVNAGLTSEQKGFATASYETESNLVSGTGRAGTTLTLKSRITLDFIFKNSAIGTDYTGLYAVATYTDHYGETVETRIDTVKVYNANLGYVSVPGLAVADYGQAVTCTVYDAEGNVLAWATDSIEGYAHRMKGSLPGIVEAIVKFGVSSYNYFH